MVAQVLADAGQLVLHLDAERLQQRCGADARDLQELRRVHRAATQDHFLPGAHFHRRAVAAPLAVAHADGALALEHDRGRLCMGAHREVGPRHGGMKITTRGTDPAAVPDDALDVAHARLLRAVIIRVARDALFDRAFDEGLAQRIAPFEIGDRQVALVAAEGRVGIARHPVFAAAEVGKHVGIAPAAIAALCPAVEVETLAAIVDVAVDRAGATQRLAARCGDRPAAGPFARLGLVEPVHLGIDQRVHEAGRDMDEGMPVAWTGFQYADRDVGILAQPAGQHAARRAGAHDHVVETLHSRRFLPY